MWPSSEERLPTHQVKSPWSTHRCFVTRGDQRITAAAAKNSGGIVIAQVKWIAANGSIKPRDVGVPGPLVDCVVVVDEKEHDALHGMSYVERNNPSLTGEIQTPVDELEPVELDARKHVARRAFFRLQPNKIVNLGIGLPEGVASVATEEGMLDYITISTKPFGVLPASGHSFEAAAFNASSLMEMNQVILHFPFAVCRQFSLSALLLFHSNEKMLYFYDGGGLNMSFLGGAQINAKGYVNVSRMSQDRLIEPGVSSISLSPPKISAS
jgi:propionate CoA-transferase